MLHGGCGCCFSRLKFETHTQKFLRAFRCRRSCHKLRPNWRQQWLHEGRVISGILPFQIWVAAKRTCKILASNCVQLVAVAWNYDIPNKLPKSNRCAKKTQPRCIFHVSGSCRTRMCPWNRKNFIERLVQHPSGEHANWVIRFYSANKQQSWLVAVDCMLYMGPFWTIGSILWSWNGLV